MLTPLNSTTPSSTILSASICIDQRSCPLGVSLQASAITNACCAPSNFGIPPGAWLILQCGFKPAFGVALARAFHRRMPDPDPIGHLGCALAQIAFQQNPGMFHPSSARRFILYQLIQAVSFCWV